jgi:Domain of unknown function (DUF4307)
VDDDTDTAPRRTGASRAGPRVRPAGRYGDVVPPWHRTAARLLALVAAAVALGWVVWAGLHQADRDVRWDDVGFRVTGDSEVMVTFDVIKDPDATVTCRLEAMNRQYAVVGVAQVKVGPSAARVTRHREPVLTQERAVTGVVKQCQLT